MGRNQSRHGVAGVGQPALIGVDDAETFEQRVQRPDLRIIDPFPHQPVDHRRDRPRYQDQRPHQSAARKRPAQEQRDQQAQHHDDHHRQHGECRRHPQCGPEFGAGQDIGIVAEPHHGEDARALQIVAMQADPQRVADRVGNQQQDDDQRGRIQQKREDTGAAEHAPGGAASARRAIPMLCTPASMPASFPRSPKGAAPGQAASTGEFSPSDVVLQHLSERSGSHCLAQAGSATLT